MNENNSGTNTVLIVIVILVLVGFVMWFVTSRTNAPVDNDRTLDVNVDLPDGNDGGNGGGTGTQQ